MKKREQACAGRGTTHACSADAVLTSWGPIIRNRGETYIGIGPAPAAPTVRHLASWQVRHRCGRRPAASAPRLRFIDWSFGQFLHRCLCRASRVARGNKFRNRKDGPPLPDKNAGRSPSVRIPDSPGNLPAVLPGVSGFVRQEGLDRRGRGTATPPGPAPVTEPGLTPVIEPAPPASRCLLSVSSASNPLWYSHAIT